VDEVRPVARVPTVEHREPCESRGSRTVLGAPGGEIPPGDSTFTSVRVRPLSGHCGHEFLRQGRDVPRTGPSEL